MQFICSFGSRGALAFCMSLATIPSAALSQELPNQRAATEPAAPQAVGVPLWNEFRYGMSPEAVVEILKSMDPKFRPEAKYRKGKPAEIKMRGAYISFDMFDQFWHMKFTFDDRNRLSSVAIDNSYDCIDEQMSLMGKISYFMEAKYPQHVGRYALKLNGIHDIINREMRRSDVTAVEISLKTISAYEIAKARAFPIESFSQSSLVQQYSKCPKFGGDEALLNITYSNRSVQEAAERAAARANSESEIIRREAQEKQIRNDINKL